jgi:hypothetical protein
MNSNPSELTSLTVSRTGADISPLLCGALVGMLLPLVLEAVCWRRLWAGARCLRRLLRLGWWG